MHFTSKRNRQLTTKNTKYCVSYMLKLPFKLFKKFNKKQESLNMKNKATIIKFIYKLKTLSMNMSRGN